MQKAGSTEDTRLGVVDKQDPAGCGGDLFQEFEPFFSHRRLEIGKASEVAAGAGQALDEAAPHRISDRGEYDRDAGGRAGHRPQRERPCAGRTAETRDELPPPHSITSSARARSAGGTVMPSALAVFRLITK